MKYTNNDLVVLNDLPDAQVYMIKSVNGFNVEMCPYPGSSKDIQWADISMLKQPTNEQLNNINR